MAFIKALTYYLPEHVLTNEELDLQLAEVGGIASVAKTMGVETRCVAAENETACDLAVKAAEKLFAENNLSPKDIDFLLFCTQGPDYFMPSTSCIIQDRLGVPTTAGAFGFDLGCSGYVYGLAMANSFVDSGLAKNVLLLTAETASKNMYPLDKNRALFGDAAAATIISSNGMAEIGKFEKGTDGSGYEQIIIKNGGWRNKQLTGATYEDSNGNIRRDDYFYMDGEAVFNFTVDRIPLLIEETLKINETDRESIDYYIFHQANKFMLNTLRKINAIPKDKFFVDISDTGNTTSSTVPIGLYKSLQNGSVKKGMNVMVAGFGVGLSWASTILKF
jgi:3-oxoacyl-[acyl-carrier-protein] synthase-3